MVWLVNANCYANFYVLLIIKSNLKSLDFKFFWVSIFLSFWFNFNQATFQRLNFSSMAFFFKCHWFSLINVCYLDPCCWGWKIWQFDTNLGPKEQSVQLLESHPNSLYSLMRRSLSPLTKCFLWETLNLKLLKINNKHLPLVNAFFLFIKIFTSKLSFHHTILSSTPKPFLFKGERKRC